MARSTALALALAAVASTVQADCHQFFYKQRQAVVVQQVVYPAVAVSPYIYQAGRDVEADAFAAKVAKLAVPLIVQQLQGGQLRQPLQQPALQPQSVMQAKCAKCHTGPEAKGGVVLDGLHQIPCSTITSAIRNVSTDKMPRGGPALTAEQKGALLEELLRLEADRPIPTPTIEAPPPPTPVPAPPE